MLLKNFETLSRASLQLPGLFLHLSSDWGSAKLDSRAKIRNAIANDLRSRSWPKSAIALESQFAALADLSHPPKFEFAALSISHCRAYGGYALSPDTDSIGFDIEEGHRITREACERISREDERPIDLPLLWSAKEAAYKALSLQGEAISSVRILRWSPATEGALIFEAVDERGKRCSGLAARSESDFILALAKR